MRAASVELRPSNWATCGVRSRRCEPLSRRARPRHHARQRPAGRQRADPAGACRRGGPTASALARRRTDAGGDRRADRARSCSPRSGVALRACSRTSQWRRRPRVRPSDEADRTVLLGRAGRAAPTRAWLGDGVGCEPRPPASRAFAGAARDHRARDGAQARRRRHRRDRVRRRRDPVVRRGDRLVGVDAVIDKDRASALLARGLGVDAAR